LVRGSCAISDGLKALTRASTVVRLGIGAGSIVRFVTQARQGHRLYGAVASPRRGRFRRSRRHRALRRSRAQSSTNAFVERVAGHHPESWVTKKGRLSAPFPRQERLPAAPTPDPDRGQPADVTAIVEAYGAPR
jgi:hypothetical protein